jgi:hypothetical protein
MNKNIPQYKDSRTGEPSVLQYLNNTLPSEDIRKIEETLTEDQMLVDAIEGLRQIDTDEAAKIDLHLKNYIKRKVVKKSRSERRLRFPAWLLMTITILLLLIVLAYFVITKLLI